MNHGLQASRQYRLAPTFRLGFHQPKGLYTAAWTLAQTPHSCWIRGLIIINIKRWISHTCSREGQRWGGGAEMEWQSFYNALKCLAQVLWEVWKLRHPLTLASLPLPFLGCRRIKCIRVGYTGGAALPSGVQEVRYKAIALHIGGVIG